MDAPLTPPDALIRPWRLATLAASLIAAIELVLLLVLAFFLLAKPLSRALQHQATAVATTPPKHHAAPVHRAIKRSPVTKPRLAPSATHVLVLNGNGRAGAAHTEAARLQGLGYLIGGAANAKRSDYATTVMMFRPGYSGDAHRLARRLGVSVVGPLDGIPTSALHGSQLVVILGAS